MRETKSDAWTDDYWKLVNSYWGSSAVSTVAIGYATSRKLSNQEKLNPSNIKKVIFNPPATIVIFKDDTKVIARAHNENFDEEKGFMACMMQIMFPSRAEFNRVIDKGIEESLSRK